MKTLSIILVSILLSTLISCHQVEEINADQLSEIQSSSKIWIVYGGSNDAHIQTLTDVSIVLAGFFKVGLLAGGEDKLRLYADEETAVVQFEGQFTVNAIVDFVLSNTNVVIQARSKVANEAKANKQYIEREAERATKEWNDEQELRKKSDTIVLDVNTWSSVFLKEREPYLINFYQSNCSSCIDLNREWESVSTALKGKVRVAKLNITEAQSLEADIKLSSYPSIRFYPVGTKNVDSYQEFDGIKKKFSILEWANLRLQEKQSNVDIPELNKENYNNLCKNTKSTCVITFLADDEIPSKIIELASKYLKKPISFLISKKGSQPKFEAQVEVTSAPETVLIYPKGGKLLRMAGMDFNVIDETINEITLGNRNGFIKYKFAEQLN